MKCNTLFLCPCLRLSLEIRPKVCGLSQVDVMNVCLCFVCIDEEENADALGETVLNGTLSCIEEGHKVESLDTACTRCRKGCCQILSYTKDRRTDVGGSNGIRMQKLRDKLLRRLPDFLFVIVPDSNGATYTAHRLHPLMYVPDKPKTQDKCNEITKHAEEGNTANLRFHIRRTDGA